MRTHSLITLILALAASAGHRCDGRLAATMLHGSRHAAGGTEHHFAGTWDGYDDSEVVRGTLRDDAPRLARAAKPIEVCRQ